MDTDEAVNDTVKSDLKNNPESSTQYSLELLSRDLIQCKRERDEYRAVADRLRARCHALASEYHFYSS